MVSNRFLCDFFSRTISYNTQDPKLLKINICVDFQKFIKIFKRSIAGKIEFWAKMGKLAEENPDLPLSLIQDILLGKEQIKTGEGTPYVFGEGE